jgi:hypothetical protein
MANKNNEIVKKLVKHIRHIQTYCQGKTYEDHFQVYTFVVMHNSIAKTINLIPRNC